MVAQQLARSGPKVGRPQSGALYLVHEECPTSGQFFSVAGGRVTRVLYASPKGYFNPEIAPEDVRDNWKTIFGEVHENGQIEEALEITSLAGEFRTIRELFG